jgi:hypothetical protein
MKKSLLLALLFVGNYGFSQITEKKEEEKKEEEKEKKLQLKLLQKL